MMVVHSEGKSLMDCSAWVFCLMTLCFSVSVGQLALSFCSCNVTTFPPEVQYLPIGICFSMAAFRGKRVCGDLRKVGTSICEGGVNLYRSSG